MNWVERARAWFEDHFPEVADFGTDDEEEQPMTDAPDPARVAAYAEALHLRRSSIDPDWQSWLPRIHAVTTVADEEQADLRAEVARLRVACTEFEDAYVGEHEDRVAAEAEVERVRGVLRDAYGKLWNQAVADYARADAAETKVRAVEALADRVPPPDFVRADGTEVRDGCRGHIDVRVLRAALAVVPPGVTPPAEPCPYETRYALHSNGMKCCDEDGA